MDNRQQQIVDVIGLMFPYYEDMNDIELVQTASRRIGAEKGIQWADDNPKENLVDINKVLSSIKDFYNETKEYYKQFDTNKQIPMVDEQTEEIVKARHNGFLSALLAVSDIIENRLIKNIQL